MRKNMDYHSARWDEPFIMQLGTPGERGMLLPAVEEAIREETGDILASIPDSLQRKTKPELPEISQPRVVRHFLRLSQMTMGLDLTPDVSQGTCTMKYSPKINESFCRSPKMTSIHPYQDEDTVQGTLELIYKLNNLLCEISGMDDFSFQPGGGSQAIYTNACVIRAYHAANGQAGQRNEIITTTFSHPVDAAAPHTAGFKVIQLLPEEDGYPSVEALKSALSERTAGLMITNPEDTGIFNPHIQEFVDLVHEAGGLCAYDQANANGILGIARARDAGFDMCHFNLHKTFSSPHGCIGPGCGAVGVKEELARFLPLPAITFDGEKYHIDYNCPESIGKVRSFLGNIQVVLRSYAWIMSLGADGLKRVAEIAVLNNNYLTKRIAAIKGVVIPYPDSGNRLEQTRFSWEKLQEDTGVNTEDVRRRIVDYGLQSYHTSHYPIIIPEPFTLEPSETFSKEDLDLYVDVFTKVSQEAYEDPNLVKTAPHRSSIEQVDVSVCDNPETWAMTWRAFKGKRQKG
ncbi:aminomethyl-transferring glycine dehydrogenase subunit GcvPB [Syntrophomonas curvata]